MQLTGCAKGLAGSASGPAWPQRRYRGVDSSHSKQLRSGALRQQERSGGGRQRRHVRAAAAAEEELSSSQASEEVEQQPTTSYSSAEEDGSSESREFAVAMAKIAWETKAEDILVLHVEPVVYWTRYMLIATVFSRPQLNAVLGKMTKEAAELFDRRLSQSPQAGPGGWELLDYGDCVVNVMTAEQREYYDLETFYGAAEEVELPFDTSEAAMSDADSWTKRM